MKMLLAIDIGNTTISLGVLKGKTVKKVYGVGANLEQLFLKKKLLQTFSKIKNHFPGVEAIVICSVVPRLSELLKPIARKVFNIKPGVIGSDIKVPIKNCYRKPNQVGQDRLVCAYAAMVLYGAPVIVVDFGTAITFDVVSRRGEYLGGAIVPGFRLYAESLFEKTALLPKVKLRPPEGIIGRDTKNSILSGIFYGYGSLYDGMIGKISKKLRQEPTIVVTGGSVPFAKKFITPGSIVDEGLIFKGLYLISGKIKSP